MFWFQPENKDVLFMDHRHGTDTLSDGRTVRIAPDIVADFCDMPFANESFHLVVFDPPHLVRAGKRSWLAKKYGVLPKDWRPVIKMGFEECMRVLKPNGVLVFKWSDLQISVGDVLKVISYEPLFGTRRGRGIFLVFMK